MKIKRIIGYIGSKVNLYDFIERIILAKNRDKKLFIDLFAGTCAVSKLVKYKTQMDIVTNDLALYSKILTAELKIEEVSKKDFKKFKGLIKELDELPLIEGVFYNEFSMGGTPKTINDKSIFNVKKKIKNKENGKEEVIIENYQAYSYSRMFFKGEVGKKIDTIRDYLKRKYEKKEINEEMLNLSLMFLLNFANSNSNSTSIYGAYLKHDKHKRIKSFYDVELLNYLEEMYEKYKGRKSKVKSYHNYANKTIEEVKKTKIKSNEIIVYWDPPYNSRSYESNYHILEYLCDLNFSEKMIKTNSKTGMKISENKYNNPFASKVKTPKIFKELIISSMELSDLLYISYNNEGLVKQKDMIEILKEIKEEEGLSLSLNTYQEEYKKFTSGENNGENNSRKNTVFEIIWEIKKVL